MRKKILIITICLLTAISLYILINSVVDKMIKSYHVTELEENTHSKNYRTSYNNIAKHGEDISIAVKFGESSSSKRFIIYDNHARKVIGSSKCAHGSGGGSSSSHPVFSNEIGSNCSSLGDYKLLRVSKMNNWDMDCIRLAGLSPTNSNASARGILIHPAPFFADPISMNIPIPVSPLISQGCFGISTSVFKQLCKLLNSGKTIYLYADDGKF